MADSTESVDCAEEMERLSDPDPFQLPRRVKQRVRCCSQSECGDQEDITYVWIDLCASRPSGSPLSMEDWLSVVDEAAGLGASWLVFSVPDSPSAFPEVWSMSQWAQDCYGMVTGFHTRSGRLTVEDFGALQELDAERCHVFVARERLETVQQEVPAGVQIHPADPEHDHRHSLCEMPGRMIFVDPEGVLYTCGMVKRNRDYLLGNVLEKKLNLVVRDPSLPHAVPEQAVRDHHACDGCPPLVARHIHGC
ncbi:MAG: hypothetical protein HYV26_03245 [Candidatus Hydrogenedentes bacterium]|nr:hypothetical protein [Candidatus Hydrogenedentota bacterium]